MEYCNIEYLMHYGVKGMKWGVRRDKKWASSAHQPSSFKSSSLAGRYMTTGSKRIARKLEKSNERDAERWKKAKEKYPEEAKLGKARLNAMEKIDDKIIKINRKYDPQIEKEYYEVFERGKLDESKLETLLNEKYRYHDMASYINGRIEKMSMNELESLNTRNAEEKVRRYIEDLDRAAR